jgi:hypothetical protein
MQMTATNELQYLLLLARLPAHEQGLLVAAEGTALEKSTLACLMFSGMGVAWPLPCLARGLFEGEWHHHHLAGHD